MTDSDFAGDEILRLRNQLAESRQLNERLETRLVEVIAERGHLYDEVRMYRAERKARALTDELHQLGVLDSAADEGQQ